MKHLIVSSDFDKIILTARLAFSKRSWPYVMAMAVPWILCAGQRCVSRLASSNMYRRSRSSYYRFLSDGKWRIRILFKTLFELIICSFRMTEAVIVIDDTLCPKWGRGIFGTSYHFDHVKRPRAGYIWGHNWVVLALVVQVGSTAWAALPFWVSLYRSEDKCRKDEFRTRHQLAAEALEAVRSWFNGSVIVLADGAYDAEPMVSPMRRLKMTLVSRIRSNARLREPQPAHTRKGKRGRKPKLGRWLPKLPQLAKALREFRRETVTIYGKRVALLVREFVAYWPAMGCVVKVVITRDPDNPKRVAYLMSTDVTLSAVGIIELFSRRWSIEQLFLVLKEQLGLDTAEVRKEKSVVRHSVLCIALATWVQVWTKIARKSGKLHSFASQLAALREDVIKQTIFDSGLRTHKARRIAKDVARLFAQATRVA